MYSKIAWLMTLTRLSLKSLKILYSIKNRKVIKSQTEINLKFQNNFATIFE